MQGFFDIKLRESGDLRDEDFTEAIRDGSIGELLKGLSVARRIQKQNQLFDNFAAYCFNRCMSGPDIANPYDLGGNRAALGILSMCTVATDPTNYQETASTDSRGIHLTNDRVNSTDGSKRFAYDDIEPAVVYTLSGGREWIEVRDRFLYLPSQVDGVDIHSISINFHEDANSHNTGYLGERWKGRLGRVLLPTPINKTAAQVLEIEYRLRMMSL